jgi:hypothetical protein
VKRQLQYYSQEVEEIVMKTAEEIRKFKKENNISESYNQIQKFRSKIRNIIKKD